MPATIPAVAWCQPASPTVPDVIMIDGHLTVPEDEARRRAALSLLTSTAKRGARKPLKGDGWVTRTRSAKVVSVPVSSPDDRITPVVTVLYDPDRTTADDAAAMVVSAAQLAGYGADHHEVSRLLATTAKKRPGLIATAWSSLSRALRSFLSVFGG